MQLVGHAAIGIALARIAGASNPVAAFGIGWFSHYLADFFPHGDEQVGEWAEKSNAIRKYLLLVTVDGLVALAVFAWYTALQEFSLAAAAAAIGSFVPDVLWGIEKLFGRRLFGPFEKLHKWNHNHLDIRVPLKYGLPIQLVLTALVWVWLARG